MNNTKIANINIKLKDLFIKYLDVTSAWHKLTTQQQYVLALLLYYHFVLKKEITNEKILWKMVFDYDTKIRIREDSIFKKPMSNFTLENILTKLRKKNIIINNQINKVFIPNIEHDSKTFKIIFNFNIVDNE